MSLSKPMRPTTSSRLRSAKSGSNSKSSVIIPQLQKSSSTETLTDKSEFLSKNQTVRKGKKTTVITCVIARPARIRKWTQKQAQNEGCKCNYCASYFQALHISCAQMVQKFCAAQKRSRESKEKVVRHRCDGTLN